MSRTPLSPALLPATLLALAATLLAACGGSRVGTAPPLPPPPPPAGPAILYESEPNDHASTANYIGELRIGDHVIIEGEITECCLDPYDGFAFYAAEPIQLTISLTEWGDADFDFCVYDPTIDEIVACWETDAHPEWGVFSIGLPADMHLVISSYYGTAEYSLELFADALGAAPVAPELPGRGDPGTAPAELTHERFAGYHEVPAERGERHFLLLKDGETEYLLPLHPEEAPGPR